MRKPRTPVNRGKEDVNAKKKGGHLNAKHK